MRRTLAIAALAAGLLAQEPEVRLLQPIPPLPGPQPLTPGGVTVQEYGPPPGPEAAAPTQPVVLEPRLRHITRLHNSMPQPLLGIGLVTGLAGTGSSDRSTRQAMLNLIRSQGLNVTLADVVAGSTALVSVTCSLPAFAKVGQPLDVKVEVMGDATSLRGGELLRTVLKAVDGDSYAVAQGTLLVGGYTAAGTNAQVSKNLNTTAWVNNGGQVVKDLASSFFSESGHLELQLLNPTPFNAASVAAGIRTVLAGSDLRVEPVDATLVRILLPEQQRTNEQALRVLNLVGDVRVRVENPAKVVVDQAAGTVLAGEGVLISPCVVGMTDLTIAIVNEEDVAQPLPWSSFGTSERVGRTRIEVQSASSQLQPLAGGASVADLLANLKQLGLTPAQLVAVFQALENGGFLHAELEVR